MTYIIIENAPPGKRGSTQSQVVNDENFAVNNGLGDSQNRLQPYVVLNPEDIIVPAPRASSGPTILQPIIVNTPVSNEEEMEEKFAAKVFTSVYDDISGITDITSMKLMTNDAQGPNTKVDSDFAAWNSDTNTITINKENEFIELQINLTVYTDTLGGSFEVELIDKESSESLGKQESTVNIQNQDFALSYKFISNENNKKQGIKIYITPELGMKISLTDIQFIFQRASI